MKATIMVVDDDPMYVDLVTYGLERAGYETVAARNGADAAAVIENKRPDAILVDLLMPVMDGMKFLNWLREKAKLEIPTLMLTSLDDRALVVDALVAGAADVVLKPVSLETLLEKLSAMIGKPQSVEQAEAVEAREGAREGNLLSEP